MKCKICGKENRDVKDRTGRVWDRNLEGTSVQACPGCWNLMGMTWCCFDWETMILAAQIAHSTGDDLYEKKCGRDFFEPSPGDADQGHRVHGKLLLRYSKYRPGPPSFEEHLAAEMEIAAKMEAETQKFRASRQEPGMRGLSRPLVMADVCCSLCDRK